MKTWHLLVGFILVLATIQAALAASACFHFEDNLTDSCDNTYHLLGDPSAPTYAAAYPTFAVSGDGSTKSAQFDDTDIGRDITSDFNVANYLITYWFKNSAKEQDDVVTVSCDGSGGAGSGICVDNYNGGWGEGIRYVQFYDTGNVDSANWANSTIWADGAWHFVAHLRNSTGMYLYVDGAVKASDTSLNTPHFSESYIAVAGRYDDAVAQPKGPDQIDEVYFLTGDFNLGNATNMYEYGTVYGAGGAPPPPANVTAPSWVAPTPDDATANNTQVVLNASCDAGLNYYLWFNTTNPPTTLVLENSTTGQYTTSVSVEGAYYYMAACYNTTSGLFSANTSVRSWTYDVSIPGIVLNRNNTFNNANRSLTLQYADWLNLSLNFTDNIDLYAWNVTVKTSGGALLYTEQNSSLSGTLENLWRRINITSWSAGWLTFNFTVADSHTATSIPDYQVNPAKSRITFKPGNDNNIKIETRDHSTITAEKEDDRYTFTVSFDDGLTATRSFEVKTDKCKLEYRPDSGYKGHFVSFCGFGEGGNWVDFEGAGGAVLSVVKRDDYHYTITIAGVPPVAIFRSVGGLNQYSKEWQWYRGTYVSRSVDSLANNPFTAYINLTTDASVSIDSVTGLFNGTYLNLTNRSWGATYEFQNLTAGTYWLYWTVNLTQDDGNFTQLFNNLTIVAYDWAIDACGTGTNVTAVWTLWNESSPSNNITGTAEIYVRYWLSTEGQTRTYNHSYSTPADTFSLCISPDNLTYYADFYLRNTITGGFTHRFYAFNLTLTSDQVDYNIYNLGDNTGVSDLKLTIRDESSYAYYPEVLVILQRRYVGEGVWRTVQMDLSGDYGLVFFNIIEETTDYRLLYYDTQNHLLKETTSMKFVCTAGVCDLTQLIGEYEATTTSDTVTATVSYDNSTGIISVAWAGSPTETHSVQIDAVKETVTGPLTLCTSLQTGASGSLDCNATGVSGQVFVTAEVDGASFAASEWVDTRTQTLGDQISRQESAVWSFGIATTLTMVGIFSPVGAIIGLTIGLISLFFLGMLGPLSLTMLIISVVVGIAISLKVRT